MNINNKKYKYTLLLSIPVLLIAQFYLFKIGILPPLIKGIDIEIVNGDYIKDIDKYIIKKNELVTLDKGNYVVMPSYAKHPDVIFKILDTSGILSIHGDKLEGLKVGSSSIGVMKGSRLLKQVEVRVVDPKIESLEVALSNDLTYVGDKASLSSVVEVDYSRFKEKKKVIYESSDEDIIKIKGDEVEAVGVGRANIKAIVGEKEEILSYVIEAKVKSIDIDSSIEIKIGQLEQLKPNINTLPKNLKHPKINYSLAGSKMPFARAIRLDSDGSIIGIREGEDIVKITCGDVTKFVNVKVSKELSIDGLIEKFEVSYEVIENTMRVNLSWDYINDVEKYDIFSNSNSINSTTFGKVKSINIRPREVKEDKKISTIIEIDISDINKDSISFYVEGRSKNNVDYKSKVVTIKLENKKPSKENLILIGNINEEEKSINLSWNKISKPSVSYVIYAKNKALGENVFKEYEKGIKVNNYTIPILEDNIDIELYVEAVIDGKEVVKSNIIYLSKSNI